MAGRNSELDLERDCVPGLDLEILAGKVRIDLTRHNFITQSQRGAE